MNWLHYLLEANCYLGIFYLLYYLLLRKETHYQLNRWYLLLSVPISFIIPVLQIGILIKVPTQETMIAPSIHPSSNGPIVDTIIVLYSVIAAIMLIVFFAKLLRLYRLYAGANKIKSSNYQLIEIQENNAFSFLSYLFITPDLMQSSTVLQHELVHIRQKHSIDILIIEIFKIVNWFNPVIHLIQNSIRELHEYIADQATAEQENDIDSYADFLVNNAYGITEQRIVNTFFHKNLLKNRIMMLYKKRSGKLARLKYLAAVPLCGGLLCVSTLGFSKTYGLVDLVPKQTVTRDTSKNKPAKPAKPAKPIKTGNVKEPVPPLDAPKPDQHKLPPPPPPAPPKKVGKNSAPKSKALAPPVVDATPPPPPPPVPPKKDAKVKEESPKGVVLKVPALYVPGIFPKPVNTNKEMEC